MLEKVFWEFFNCKKQYAPRKKNTILIKSNMKHINRKPSIFGDTVPRENLLNFKDFIPGGR
jgi:hypothetical protein